MNISRNPPRPREEQIKGFVIGLCAGLVIGFVIEWLTDLSGMALTACTVLGASMGQGIAVRGEQAQREIDLEQEVLFSIGRFLVQAVRGTGVGLVVGFLIWFVARFWVSVYSGAAVVWIGAISGALGGLIVGLVRSR